MLAVSNATTGQSEFVTPTVFSSPLTTKGDVYTYDSADARLAVGTDGYVLSADSIETTGLKWIAAPSGSSPLTTKGDLYTYSTLDARLGVGADGTTLEADAAEATGLKWVDYGDGELDYASRSSTSTQAVNGTAASIPWQTEVNEGTEITWTSGANTRLVIGETGTYKIGGFFAVTSTDARAQHAVEIYINGTGTGILRGSAYIRNSGTSWDYWVLEVATEPIELTASDYVEIFIGTTTTTSYAFGTNGANSTLVGDKSRVWVERAKARGAKGDTGATGSVSPLTTKGDIFTWDTADARLAVGTNDQVLTADSAQALGVKWATPSAFDPGTYSVSTSYNGNAGGPVDSRIDDASQVYVRGNMTATGGISANTTLFQLANAPVAILYLPCAWYDNSTATPSSFNVYIKIDTSGNASCNIGLSASDIVYFNSITFYGA